MDIMNFNVRCWAAFLYAKVEHKIEGNNVTVKILQWRQKNLGLPG